MTGRKDAIIDQTTLLQEVTRRIERQTTGIPRYNLGERHLNNLRALPSRLDLLDRMPKGGHGCEIGVDTGDFSQEILRLNQPTRLYLVDPWETRRYGQEKFESVSKRFAAELNAGRVEIIRKRSNDAIENFDDATLDWVYIDSTHSYQTTIAELHAYSRKLKPGGMLAGHDYVAGNLKSALKYGVIEAVHEFCVTEDWEFRFLTMEQTTNPSFAIRKLDGT